MKRLLAFAAPVLALVVVAAAAPSSASAAIITYTTTMSGAAESPANNSPGTGTAKVTYDNALHTMRVEASFSGLTGNTTNAHIHAATLLPFQGTAGVATPTPTFPGFPAGVTSGSYDHTLDLTLTSSWNSSYISANGGTPASAEAAFFDAMDAGKAYFNVHSTTFSGGEIRGFMVVPEPGALTLLGAAALLGTVRRRRAS